jgi:RNA polymerase primary sigma factor
MRPDKIDALERARMAVESLDENLNAYMTADVSTSRGGTKGDLMDSNEHVTYDEDPFDTVQDVELQEDISAALATLAPRERNVLRMAYGMGAGEDDALLNEPMNLGDIGTRYGLSRERIRQIQSGALSKLRQPVRALPLAKFVDDDDERPER